MDDLKEKQDLIDYCNNIINFAPEGSKEHSLAKIALLEIKGEMENVLKMAEEIKANSVESSPQSKIAAIVLNAYQKNENREESLQNIPAGWKLVPIEPVEEMFRFIPAMVKMTINNDEYDYSGLNQRNAKWIYKNMLNYVPKFKNKS